MIPSSRVSLALQAHHLRQVFPTGTLRIKRSHLSWTGRLRPTAFSDDYGISLTYSLNDKPRVTVPDRTRQWRGNRRPPHLYPDDSLCLYYPAAREWRRDMFLSNTVLPWTAEWLFHYEVWMATGTWTGGGIHPR